MSTAYPSGPTSPPHAARHSVPQPHAASGRPLANNPLASSALSPPTQNTAPIVQSTTTPSPGSHQLSRSGHSSVGNHISTSSASVAVSPIPASPPIISGPIPPPGPHDDPIPLDQSHGGLPMYKYPHAPISQEYKYRFENVVTEFWAAISRSGRTVTRRFRRRGTLQWSSITFELHRMKEKIRFQINVCGTSTTNNWVSIIVYCPDHVTSMLKAELQSSHLKRQYAQGSTSGLAFDLIYQQWPCDPFTLLWSNIAVADDIGQEATWNEAHKGSTLTMCGSRIHPVQSDGTSSSSFTTLACIVEIKGELYGLTTAHGIQAPHDTKSESSDSQAWPQDLDEYEFEIEEEYCDFDDNSGPTVSDLSTAECSDVLKLTATASHAISSTQDRSTANSPLAILPDAADNLPGKADCDWAIIPIRNEDRQLPNAYTTGDPNIGRRFITKVARKHPQEERSIHILTSKTIKSGLLKPGLVSVGSLSGRGPAIVWVISMDGAEKGDSGSLVIDALTGQAYGHVVASDPVGDVYIVPMTETLHQIECMFETKDVRLPDPLRLLTEAALLRLSQGQYPRAREAITALSDLVQQLCDSHEWQQLSHWVRTSASRLALLTSSDDGLAEVFPQHKYQLRAFRKSLMLDHVIRQMAFQGGSESSSFQGPCPYLDCDLILLAVLEERRFASPTLAEFRSAVDHMWKQKLDAILRVQVAELSCNCWSFRNGFVCRHMLPELRKYADIPVFSGSRFRFTYDLHDAHDLLRDYLPASSLFLSWDLIAQDPGPVSLQGLLKSKQQLRAGAFSTVYRVFTSELSEAHRIRWSLGGEEYVALKMIEKRARNFSLWLNEKEILQQLEKFNHPNIVKLLDAYCIDDNFLLLFPLAQGDLEDFMSKEPLPSHSSQVIFTWMLQQVQGLTKALEYLHVGNEHYEAFGRHGDIKPENILWYSDVGTGKLTLGRFVIADLGLSQFHRRTPGSSTHPASCLCDAVTPNRNLADRRYAAPEIEVPSRIDSAYDMWSLGCVLFEMVVWLVEGAESRVLFLERLRSDVPGRPASYWYLESTAPRTCKFTLKPEVSARLKQLHERTKELTSLHALLSHLMYGGLLDPDPSHRPTARDLGEILRLVEKGTTSNQTTPVWNRSWVMIIDSLDEYSPMRHVDFKEKTWSSCKLPSRRNDRLNHKAYPDMANTITDMKLLSDRNAKISDPFWQCDDLTECNWNDDGLPFKQKCPFCEEIARPAALKPHIKGKHRFRRSFDCTDCGGLFVDRRQLSLHREGVDVRIGDGIRLRIMCVFPKNVLATSVRDMVHGAVAQQKPIGKASKRHWFNTRNKVQGRTTTVNEQYHIHSQLSNGTAFSAQLHPRADTLGISPSPTPTRFNMWEKVFGDRPRPNTPTFSII
ncbi:hypothetical protein N0V90_009663 [Kalmusia sp. IMI 367209]|nr:hypothetical protein N0V90_009663 [Kalmusia sp. IMI 367209]